MWTSEWQARYQCAALYEADGISDPCLVSMPHGISIAIDSGYFFLVSFLLSKPVCG
jgi:hypothetical protein